MGLFSKAKEGMQDAADAAGMATAYDQQQAAARRPGMIGVKGMGPIAADPALIGGPSTTPLAEDDPMLQPAAPQAHGGLTSTSEGYPPSAATGTVIRPWVKGTTSVPPRGGGSSAGRATWTPSTR